MTLARRIIPCLDVDQGRVVKGTQFVNLRDAGDPAELAARYAAELADEIVFLDITASHESRNILIDAVRRTAEAMFIPLTVGGGVRSLDGMEELLCAGAEKVSLNTAALNDPALITAGAERFGEQCIVVAVDARRENGGFGVYTHGGRHPAGRDAVDWAREATERGAGEILLTSMDRDGTGDGYDIDLCRAVADVVTVPVVASGGAGTPAHLCEVLTTGHADAALAASIFHYGAHPVPATKAYLRAQGIPVRL
jgi:cyclase